MVPIYLAPPSEDPPPCEASDIFSLLRIPVMYGNGVQASPTGIATFALHCPILNLADELDIVLGHEWCKEHGVVISYKDENVTFVHKGRPYLMKFNDSCPQNCASTSSLCLIRQAPRFVQRQQRAYLVVVCWVAEPLAGDDTYSTFAQEAESLKNVIPQVLKILCWRRSKTCFLTLL